MSPPQLANRSGLVEARARYRRGEALPWMREAVMQADMALSHPPRSVVDKKVLASSGDPHDYSSIGIYWWPDPATPDGLPWVRRDGRVNPDTFAGDHSDAGRLQDMLHDIETLTVGWWLTGDERYAEHAAAMLRTWFLADSTRMNPHLRHAQRVPGRDEGRDFGIITGFRFVPMLDAAVLLEGSRAWSREDACALRGWFSAYLHWLRTHDYGISIAGAANNHGSWYAAQVLWVQAYVDAARLDPREVAGAFARRIALFDAEGWQPHELDRTKSLTYSFLNLYAVSCLARLGDALGLDLWRSDARYQRAVAGLSRYVAEPTAWPHEQIEPLELDVVRPPLLLASRGLGAAAGLGDAVAGASDPLGRVTLIDTAGLDDACAETLSAKA